VVFSLVLIGAVTKPYGHVEGEGVPPLLVDTFSARHEPGYVVTRQFIGVVEATRDSRVGFELGGLVAEVLVDEGDFVNAGEAVARLDTSLLESQRAELVADRDRARATKELAEVTRKRMGEALERKAVSMQQWDEADKNLQSLTAALARAESAIHTVDVRLAKSVLRAPFDSLVAERFIDEGQVMETGAPVLRLLENVEPQVRIGVAGASVDTIAPGQKYDLRIRDRIVAATVKTVLPVRGNGTRTVDVLLTLQTRFDGIRHGDLATLRVERLEPQPGYWLPLTALTESSRGLWACYIAEPMGNDRRSASATHRLARRELEVLHQEVDRVFVRGTLESGELVVSKGLQRIMPHQEVRLGSRSLVLSEGGAP